MQCNPQSILLINQIQKSQITKSLIIFGCIYITKQMALLLQKLRKEMILRNISHYLIPRTDEHQSQYLVPTDERVQFISGFSGSNALALVSKHNAYLWTDGRYLLQAEKELYQGWQLKKQIEGEKKWFQFVTQNYQKQIKIGFDPKLVTAQNAIDRIKYYSQRSAIFQPLKDNLVDLIWENKPQSVKPQIFIHEEWAGKQMSQKINWVRANIKQKQGQSAIFNDLPQIAWILNLRSSEIPHNPFFKGVLKVNINGGTLFIPQKHPELNNNTIRQFLSKEDIEIKQYEPTFDSKSLICKNQLNYHIYDQIKDKKPIQWQGIGLYRAVRTEKEINGFKRCHIADGVALAKFWAWRSKQDEPDEYECAQKIDNLRYNQKHNKGLSFDTISGGGPNGAIIHYRPTRQNSSKVKKNMIHLLDSGGQYLDGTTDVTRAFHFGKPSYQQKESYTQVLQGNLDIERLRWPANKLTGADIDILARRHLWKKGKDYLHGTGHGVGYFGGVHQGPVGISRLNKTKFQAGMIVTNEPGYYQSGKYGIRIENMLVVHQQNGFNYFEVLTLCPYDRNLIQKTLLNEEDIDYINKYHSKVRQVLSRELKQDEEALQWLHRATESL